MGRPKVYNINEKYFDILDHQDKFYWLGFIFADGHVNKRQFTIGLAKKDQSVLESFMDSLDCHRPLQTRVINDREYCILAISSVYMCKRLAYLGIHSNKSNNSLVLPEYLDDSSARHFIRGYFDGNGYIGRDSTDRSICISGGLNLLTGIKKLFADKVGINSYIRYRYSEKRPQSCHLESKGSLQLEKIYNYLYNDARLYLKRKHELFFEAHEQGRLRRLDLVKFEEQKQKVLELFVSGLKQHEIKDALNIPFSTVRKWVQNFRKLGLCQ